MAVAFVNIDDTQNPSLATNGSITFPSETTASAGWFLITSGVGNATNSQISSVTVGGTAASLLGIKVMPDGVSHVEIWGLWCPAPLTAVTVVVTYATAAGAGAVPFLTLATGTDINSIGNVNTANGTSATATASVTCSFAGSVPFGGAFGFGSTLAAGTNTTRLVANNDGAGDFGATLNNNQATTLGNSFAVTATQTSGQWAVVVVEIKPAGSVAATFLPPPKHQVPVWDDGRSTTVRSTRTVAALLATPPQVDTPIPYRRPTLASDWWAPTTYPVLARVGIAAVIAIASVASSVPPQKPQRPQWNEVAVTQPVKQIAALLAPQPATPDAPLPNDIRTRSRQSSWPTQEWIARTAPSKLTSSPTVTRYPIVKSGRKMFDQQGAPFRIKGRTAWGIVSLTPTLRAAFLDDTLSHGFNAIECQLTTHLPEIRNIPFDGAGNLPFLKRLDGANWTGSLTYGTIANEAPDFSTPNSAYWNFVDGLVADCLSRNILLMMFPLYLGGPGQGDGWVDEMTANGDPKTQGFGAFVASRYSTQPHIVWMTAGDTAAGFQEEGNLITGITSVTTLSTDFSSERAGGSISTDGGGILGPSTTLNGAYDWATVITQCQRAYSYTTRTLPSYMVEEPYDQEGTDGNSINPTFATQPVRRYEWWGWLNTIGGYIAGNGYVWRFKLTGTPPSEDDYRNHLNTQNTQDLGRLNAFMEVWPNTNDLVPGGLGGMRTLVVSGAGTIDTSNFNCAAQTNDGTLMIAYVSPGGAATIQLDLRSMSGAAPGIRARWWDPTAGTFTTNASAAGTFTLANTASAQSFTTPGTNSAGDNDWVLVLDAGQTVPAVTAVTSKWWGNEPTVLRQRATTIAAVLATPPIVSNPPLRGPNPTPALWADPAAIPVHQVYSEVAPLISGPVANVPPPRMQVPVFPYAWSPPQRAPGIAPQLTFAFTVAATVPAPTSAIALVEDFDFTIVATVPAPTSAITLVEDFDVTIGATVPPPTSAIALQGPVQLIAPRQQRPAFFGWEAVIPTQLRIGVVTTLPLPITGTIAATVPAPTSTITLVEDFDLTIAATVPAPTSAINLQGPVQLITVRQQRPNFFGWEASAPTRARTGIAAVLPLPITGSIVATVPAPTSAIALNTPVTSFNIDVAGTVPAPTASIAMNETLAVSIAGTVPAPTAALALAEAFNLSVAGTVPAPTAALALAEAFNLSVAGTVPAPTAALALAEAFNLSVAGTVPAPTAAFALAEAFVASIAGIVPVPTALLAFGGVSVVSVVATVPAPTSAVSLNETLSAHVTATVPAPSSSVALNSQSANPTLTSVTPQTIFTGGMLVTLAGSNFQTAYPLPVSNGVLPEAPPTVQVLFDGVPGDDVQVYSGSQLTVIAPPHDPGTVSVTVQNLDPNGDPLAGEVVTLNNAVTYERADLSVFADFTRVNKTLIRLLKQQVIANVSMATSVDYSDQAGNPLKVSAVASVPAVTISPPSTRIRYGEYAEDADRNEENIGINFNRRNTFRTIDITWQIRIFDDNKIRALNLLALLHQVLKDNVLLSMDRDPADLSKGKVQYELYPSGEFNFADSPNNSNLFVAAGSVTLYGYWFEDIASFPEQAVVEKGVQAETIEVTTGAFRP